MQNKQQEYLKQREKLKYVTQSHINHKALDPDIMIEQLISDEKTFKFNAEPQLTYTLPKWLKTQNNLVPALYEQVWQAVKLGPANQFCDTRIITQFFTTSGLSLEKLGHLWSLTNVYSPGALTQQELYVMLTLIALVQAGYNVKDISIIKGINHPILPQLDYNFLNIVVANPAINRSVSNPSIESRPTKAPTLNGFNSVQADAVPLRVESSNSTKENTVLDVSFNKPNSDVIFAIPGMRLPNHSANLLSIEKTTELNVGFPEIRSVEPKREKKLDFLSSHDFASEPKSLDLPVFSAESVTSNEDDEFSEFQSAVITIPSTEEYADFQSASPIMKYEFDNFAVLGKYDLDLTPKLPQQRKPEPTDSNSINDDDDVRTYKTTHEADKYDVFRSLIEQNEEKNNSLDVNETGGEEEDDDDDEEEEEEEEENKEEAEVEEEFNEFSAVSGTTSKEKPETSIKEKCLKACLQLLQEGLNVFSSIPSEGTIREVLSNERGYRYLNQLKIVYETSQRFQRPTEHVHLNDALQITWAKLSSYTKYLPSEDLLEDDMYAENEIDAMLCKLCETKCDMNYVRYAGNHYHVTCINLFLHFVEDSEISAMLNL